MKYFVLIWAGLWRKRLRTIFTMLSIVAAFLLFGLLQGIDKGFDNVVGNLNVHRLFTQNKYSMVEGMPIAHADRIETVQGVTGTSYLAYFGGFYRDKHNSVGVFAADVPKLFKMYNEFKIPQEQVEAMRTTRPGALIARGLATKYGWKIGDKVPIGTSIWTRKNGRNDYQFDIVGIFDFAGVGATGQNSFYINFDYFDEERGYGNGTVHFIVTDIDDPRHADAISQRIDELFVNSSDEVNTQSEQSFVGSRLKQLADVNFIVTTIVGAVLATLLFLTGNTMMQSMRERIPELAVLKTLGFTDHAVSVMVLCESLLLCVFAALIGLGLARLAFIPLSRTLGNIEFKSAVVYVAIAIAACLAVATGALPALRARRLNIVDALADR